MSRYVISCGGTGGHLSPGIALAEALKARGREAILLISEKKVDARLSEKYPQLRFERMPGSGFGWQPATFVRFMASQTRAIRYCLRLLRERPADAVIGFGGFTSAPLVTAARLRHVPAALHEANRIPGRAVRTLGRFVQRVYLPPGVTIEGIGPANTRHVGLPVRAEIQRQPAEAARAVLGLNPSQRVLVVLGGSQGSSPLNDWTRRNIDALAAEGIQVYCVTGLGKGQDDRSDRSSGKGEAVRAIFESFSDRIATLLSAADLVLSRAGAGTIAELIRCEAPAILIPFPQAADDHQRANAADFQQHGGGFVVEQTKLGDLLPRLLATIRDDEALRRFRDHLRLMDRANNLDLMLDDLDELARGGRAGRRSAMAAVA